MPVIRRHREERSDETIQSNRPAALDCRVGFTPSQCWVKPSPDGIDVPSRGTQHEETVRMTSITIGLDVAKSVFQVHVEDAEGRTVTRRRRRRSQAPAFFARQAASVVGGEARGSAPYWGRLLRALGHEVRLTPAAYVRPFLRRRRPMRGMRRRRPVSGGTLSAFGATPVLARFRQDGMRR